MNRPAPAPRGAYARFLALETRWMDNDVYGHVNNVAYYSYFDTAVNRFLIEEGVLRIHAGPVIGLVVETGCHFFRPLAFPDALDVGIRVERLGTSSVRYAVGIFRRGEPAAAAQGHFVHVYVDRERRAPTPLPPALRSALEKLRVGDGA